MKKKTMLLTLVLALAMVLTSISSVFAAAPPTDKTKAAITPDIQSMTDLKDEVSAETFASALATQVVEGKYKLIGTEALKAKLDKGDKMVIVDTMPEAWWVQRHLPGAINQVIGGPNKDKAPKYEISSDEAKALLSKVSAAAGKKTITKWYNKKTKKWVTKKPAKKYRGKSKKMGRRRRVLRQQRSSGRISVVHRHHHIPV